MKRRVSLGEAAQILGVAKGTVVVWAKRGLLYPIKISDHRRGGCLVFFTVEDVKFLKKVIKRLPPRKRHGRHILYEYRRVVEEEWREAKGVRSKK